MKNSAYPLYKAKSLYTIKELVDYTAKKYKNATAFSYRISKEEIVGKSYIDFQKDIAAFGTVLLSKGIKGNHIALFSENSYEWLVVYFATIATNNVIIPFDKEINGEEALDLVSISEADYLFYSDYTKEAITKVIKKINIKKLIFMGDKKNGFNALLTRGYQLQREGDTSFSKIKPYPDKMSTLLFTSGTTGVPKGVILTQKSIVMNMIDCSKLYNYHDSILMVLPMHHSFAITAAIMGPLFLGTKIFINRGLKEIPKDLTEFKPSDLILVPLFIETLYNKIWLTAKQQGKDKLLKALIVISDSLFKLGIDIRRKLFKSVLKSFGGNMQYIISGAAPLDPKYIKGFRSLGVEIRQGYGITESSPIVSVCRLHHYRDASVGLIIPEMSVKIVDPDEKGRGEIHLKGPHVMQGYYKNPKETKRVLKSGWFNTEDIGYIDEDGFLYIAGRKKNLIILSNGKNISAEELEMKINKINMVKETIVTGANESGRETSIQAEVFLDEEAIKSYDPTNLKALLDKEMEKLNRQLPIYKNINKVVIRETEFPKTTTKKIKR